MSAGLPEDILSTCVSSSFMLDNILKWLSSFFNCLLPSTKYVSLSSGSWLFCVKYAFSLRSGTWSDFEGCLQAIASPSRFVSKFELSDLMGKEFNEAPFNKKAFSLRYTACLPSSTSQLVCALGGILGCCGTLVLGGPLPPVLLGSSSTSTSRRRSSSTSTSGVLFHQYFWGSHVTYPIMHLMLPVCSPDTNWWVWFDAATYILLHQCIMGKVTWDPPPWTDWLADKHDWKHYIPAIHCCQ